MSKSYPYFVGLFLITYFAMRLTEYLDKRVQHVWGANWLGSAEWVHATVLIVAFVCIMGPLLGVWRAIYFKKWGRSK
jgi:hypothetical protein